jgi:hypothetical protein
MRKQICPLRIRIKVAIFPHFKTATHSHFKVAGHSHRKELPL